MAKPPIKAMCAHLGVSSSGYYDWRGRAASKCTVADMTCIPTWANFLYLAVVIGIYSRKVVGCAFGEHMGAQLVGIGVP